MKVIVGVVKKILFAIFYIFPFIVFQLCKMFVPFSC